MGKELEVKVPDIGNYTGVPVIEVLVKPGDQVDKDAPLVVLESDKATMEVPSPVAGTVRGLRLKVGDKVSQGDAILTLESAEESAPPSRPPPATAGGGAVNVTVPDIGNYSNVPVIEVFVKDGDTVEKDASLLTLESEKATMDVPAPQAGVVRGLKLKVGDKVSQGDLICLLESAEPVKVAAAPTPSVPSPLAGEGQGEGAPAAKPSPAPLSPALSPQAARGSEAAAPGPTAGLLPHASPSIRKLARELGVDLSKVTGTGPKGRILQDDVQAFVKKSLSAAPESRAPGPGLPPIPAVDFSQWGAIETKPLARIRKLSAAHLHRSWLNVPHVTQHDDADITELEAFRKAQSEESGIKLTLLPFLLKAVGVALKAYPEFNASLAPDGENLILKKYCHLGFAADTPNGLVVPVVKDVWSKGIVQLANECGELAKKARDGKLKPDEMKGGCFSISSLGGLGVGGGFTPIVNAPEVAILGVSRAAMKPVWIGKDFAPRLLLPLSLSYDHRVIDGAYAARFTVHLVKLLSDLRRVAL